MATSPFITDAFTQADRRRLLRALETTPHARVYRRVEAVLFVAEGCSISESARRVHAARTSIERWVRYYVARRDATALTDAPRAGRPRVAAQLTERRLAAALKRDPRTLGYRATTWTVALLARYCGERLACAISPRTLRRRLRDGGYRWKRPRYFYSERATHLAQKKGLSVVA